MGAVSHATGVNKYGRSTKVDSGVATDIWDRANATDLQIIWTAPTVARVHNIKSSSASDASAGTGARTMQVFGLTAWDTAEVMEVVTLNGVTDVPTVNSYVIIHRLRVITWGSAGPNVGVITATAVTDATVTAQIGAGNGNTLMAIYGVPSTQTFYMPKYYGTVLSANLLTNERHIDMTLLVWLDPPTNTDEAYIVQSTQGFSSRGGALEHRFDPFKAIPGPAVIKMQGAGSAANLDVSAGFNGYLVTA